jgi:hypothetical protein
MAIGDRILAGGIAAAAARAICGDATATGSAGGTTQANSPVLAAVHTYTTTCAAGAGWTVPSNLNAGDELTISNSQNANAMLLWPPVGGGQFNNLSANASFSVGTNKAVRIIAITPLLFNLVLSA